MVQSVSPYLSIELDEDNIYNETISDKLVNLSDFEIEWNQVGDDILGETRQEYFGREITLTADGKTIAAINHSANGVVNARIYKFNEEDNDWGAPQTVIYDTPERDYAESIEITPDGEFIFVGWREGAQGYVNVLKENDNGIYESYSEITGPSNFERFGWDLDISADGTVAVVGGSQGNAGVFKYEDDDWKLIGSDSGINYFGQSVAISPDGTLVAIGAPANVSAPYNKKGTVSLYEVNGSGLTKLDTGDQFNGPG